MAQPKPTRITPNAFNIPLSCQSITPTQLQSIITVEKFTGDLYYLNTTPIDHVTFELVVELVDHPKKTFKDSHLLYTPPTISGTNTNNNQPTLYMFRFHDWENNEFTLTMPLPTVDIPLHTFIRLRVRPYIPRSLLHDYLVCVHKYHTSYEQHEINPNVKVLPLTHLNCSALKFFYTSWDKLPTAPDINVIPRLHSTLSNLYTSTRGMGIQMDVTNLSKVVWDYPDMLPVNHNPNQFAMINQYKDRLLSDVAYPCLHGELISRDCTVHIRGIFFFQFGNATLTLNNNNQQSPKSKIYLEDPLNPENVFFFDEKETIQHNRDRPIHYKQKGFVFSAFNGCVVDLTLKLHPTRYQQSIEILSIQEVTKAQLESTSQKIFEDLSTYQLLYYFNPKMSPAVIPYSHRQTVFDELEVPQNYYQTVAFQLDNYNYTRRHPLVQQKILQQQHQQQQQQQQHIIVEKTPHCPRVVTQAGDSTMTSTNNDPTTSQIHPARCIIHVQPSIAAATTPTTTTPLFPTITTTCSASLSSISTPNGIGSTIGDDYQPQPKKLARGLKVIKIISTSKSRSDENSAAINTNNESLSPSVDLQPTPMNNTNTKNDLHPAIVPATHQLPLPFDGQNPKPTFTFPFNDYELWSQQLDLLERYYEKELDDLDGSYKDYIKTATKPLQPDEFGDRQRYLDATKLYETECEKTAKAQKELDDKSKELDEYRQKVVQLEDNYKTLQLLNKYQTLELTVKFEQSEKEKYKLQLLYQTLLNSTDGDDNNHQHHGDDDYVANVQIAQQQRTQQIQQLRSKLQQQNTNTNNNNNNPDNQHYGDDNGNGIKRKNLEPAHIVTQVEMVDHQTNDYHQQYQHDDNFTNKKQRSNLE
jgi:hypothetical protein